MLPILEEHREQVRLESAACRKSQVLILPTTLFCIATHLVQLRQAVRNRSVSELQAVLAHAEVLGVDGHDDEMDAQFRVDAFFYLSFASTFNSHHVFIQTISPE
jgi:hypothetical protein